MASDPVKVGEYLGMAFYVDPELAEGEMELRDPKTGRVILRVVGIAASPAPETRTAETCSGCGKSISGPRFCLACVERVDEPIGAPETRTGEGAATGCATCEHAVMWGPYKADCKAGHGYGIDAKWCCGDYRSARAPSPREGTP